MTAGDTARADVDTAQAELERISGEVADLETKIASSTLEAARLEGTADGGAALAAIYDDLARARQRLGALIVAQQQASARLAVATQRHLQALTAEVGSSLVPYRDRREEALESAVQAARVFADRLRELADAERARQMAYQSVSPRSFSSSGAGFDHSHLREVQAMLPAPITHDEPLYAAVLQAAVAPPPHRPFWRSRADYLAIEAART
ncbi:hypothetical protein [Piscinibacter koreensis]|uniref:Uncharacterized protein n=1 Tax=Piscinibacter koreensis TaxID=2742824 RepID=A0A7Y6TY14_9BURK|nr:hypothetical protein [Schlegelella koreensis]NUZ07655.1 hypothetical protein [Schlegelella koreensis]